MGLGYDWPTTAPEQEASNPWDDSTIATYLEESRQAEQERLDEELARIEDQLAARDALHEDLMAELEWQVKTYERELDRLRTPFTSRTEEQERVQDRLRAFRQAIRDERRQHWQDRQQLARERRELLRQRAALLNEDLSELLY